MASLIGTFSVSRIYSAHRKVLVGYVLTRSRVGVAYRCSISITSLVTLKLNYNIVLVNEIVSNTLHRKVWFLTMYFSRIFWFLKPRLYKFQIFKNAFRFYLKLVRITTLDRLSISRLLLFRWLTQRGEMGAVLCVACQPDDNSISAGQARGQ